MYGSPRVVTCDGGQEFVSHFERGLELFGIFQHTVNADSPWENGRAERHGGLFKDLMEKGSERHVILNREDLDLLASEVIARKNS